LARADRIASLTLYEPSAFHLLKTVGNEGAAAFAEIAAIAGETAERVIAGDYHQAAAAFVDYWGGEGAWAALRPSVKAALVRWVPKAPLDFRALIEEQTLLPDLANLATAALIVRGEHAPRPTRLIAETLAKSLPAARLAVVDGAGHMGPLTHTAAVNELIATHVDATTTALQYGDRPRLRCA